jgi:hypothetical protein
MLWRRLFCRQRSLGSHHFSSVQPWFSSARLC